MGVASGRKWSYGTGLTLEEAWLRWLVQYGWGQAIHSPSNTLGGGGVQSFFKMLGQKTIVGSKCLFWYTRTRQEIWWNEGFKGS